MKHRENGDYVVSDHNRIVCVTREGKYKWELSAEELGETSIDIYGIACDQCDNVIIADYPKDKISMIHSDGGLVI